MAARGIPEHVAYEHGLGVVRDPLPGHERQEGWLVIPYLSPGGVLDLKYRCMEDHDHQAAGHPKYIGETGSTAKLYGVNAFREDSPVLGITEGELDAVVATSVVGLPSIGISGANKWCSWWSHCFEGYEEVIVLQDGDEAGEKLSKTVGANLYNCNVRIVPMWTGEDVSSSVLTRGIEAVRERIGLA